MIHTHSPKPEILKTIFFISIAIIVVFYNNNHPENHTQDGEGFYETKYNNPTNELDEMLYISENKVEENEFVSTGIQTCSMIEIEDFKELIKRMHTVSQSD